MDMLDSWAAASAWSRQEQQVLERNGNEEQPGSGCSDGKLFQELFASFVLLSLEPGEP